MRITEVKVFPVREEKLKAFVSVVFDDCFMVNDIKVIRGKDGMFISMPSRRKKNGRFKDIAHPLNNDTRQMIEKIVIGEYERAIGGDAPERDASEELGSAGTAPPPRPKRPRRRPEKPSPAADPPAEPELAESAEPETRGEKGDKSLEQVAEDHLRDSFWTT